MRHASIALALLLVAALFVTACGREEPVVPAQPTQETPPETLSIGQPTGRTVTVRTYLTEQFFEPSTATARAGDTVELTVESLDVEHTVSIPAFGIERAIPAGGSETFTLQTTSAGEIGVLCVDKCQADVTLLITVQ